MSNRDSLIVRLLIIFLAGVLTAAAFLIVEINPVEIDLAYLALLLSVAAVGLLTNLWGGLLASVVSAFLIIIVNQSIGIYPRENYLINISSELALFLIVGPHAGYISTLLARMQKRSDHWLKVAEDRTVHDETFGTLKPDWIKIRLEEEVLRAARYQRPLATVIFELDAPVGSTPQERVAALQALIRLIRSATQPPSVVAHTGSNQLLLILPEYNPIQAQTLLDEIQNRIKTELYYPPSPNQIAQGIGSPLIGWGRLHFGLSNLDGKHNAQELMNHAQRELEADER
jgi:GGDEF domain-containing protein